MKSTTLFLSYLVICSLFFNLANARLGSITLKSSNAFLQSKIKSLTKDANTSDIKTLSHIVNGVEDMLNSILADQKKHIEQSESYAKLCDEEKQFRQEEIKDSNTVTQDSKISSADIIHSIDLSKAALEKTSDFIDAINLEKEDESTDRTNNNTSHTESIKTLTDLLERASALIYSIKNQHITLDTVINDAKDNTNDLVKDVGDKNGVNTTFLQTSNNENELSYFVALETQIRSELTNMSNLETNQATFHNEFLAELESELKNLGEMKTNLENHINDMEEAHKTETMVTESAADKKERNSTILKNTIKLCADYKTDFNAAVKAREDQVKSLQEVLSILDARNPGNPELAKLHGFFTTFESEFSEYVNMTNFKKYENYQREKVENNENGKKLTKKENHVGATELTNDINENASFLNELEYGY